MSNHIPTCYLNSNDGTAILGIGAGPAFTLTCPTQLPALDAFLLEHKNSYVFGYLSYELKQHVDNLPSKKNLKLPLAYFWVPSVVAKINQDEITLVQGKDITLVQDFFETLTHSEAPDLAPFSARTPKEKYLQHVNEIKQLIQRGDLYETNYCQEYFLENTALSAPHGLYNLVNQRTEAPFSGLFIADNLWLACGSPERYVQKVGDILKSQPIKGTSPRMNNSLADEAAKQSLIHSKKERAENVMIVDLVRNDLSKIAEPGSVHVDELFGLYSFKTVHQMISTVSCKLKPSMEFSDIVKASFPMGSMTGTPKRNAVRYMDEFEDSNREIYSGSLGYFKPGGDFDFNVVIRSLAYYPTENYLSCGVGSAITIGADAQQEYEECLLKIGRLIRLKSDE
jgi:para-aminobenzoate synthetase component 1